MGISYGQNFSVMFDFVRIAFVVSKSDGFFRNILWGLHFSESKINCLYIINTPYAGLTFRVSANGGSALRKHSAGWSQIEVQTQRAPGNLLELVIKIRKS